MKAMITGIKKFAVHDGDGIRTTVFFKGCPLRCAWCHNPEGMARAPQIGFYAHLCKNCGACVKACEMSAHGLEGGVHGLDRKACVACGACVRACPQEALIRWGREVEVGELLNILLEDRAFYETTGGGVTLSGGECLCQSDFCAELLKELKARGIHTAVDTCGHVERGAMEKAAEHTDIFLYDVKAMDPRAHKACTGQENGLILENLRWLDERGKPVEIRIPYVPEYNADQIEPIAQFLAGLKCVTKVRLLAYHRMSGAKYEALGLDDRLPRALPTEKGLADAVALLRAYGLNAVGPGM